MNQSKSLTGFRLSASLIILSIAAIASYMVVVHYQPVSANAAQGPSFNKLAQNFPITTDASGVVRNVAPGEGNKFEKDFLRVGSEWDRQGDYASQPGEGNRLEVCDDGATFYLWAYAHNTIHTDNNHVNVDALDFRGMAIAKNTTVSIRSEHLGEDVYANQHSFSAVINADNATERTDGVEIYCNDHEVKLVTTDVETPSIYSWSNESINRVKHERAVAVFGAPYSIVDPDNIFTDNGSKIGYDGNLPACRYYAAYVKVQLKVMVKSDEPEVVPTGSNEPEASPESTTVVAQVELPETGFGGSDSLNYGLIALVASIAVTLTVTQRAAVARAKRSK